MGKETYYSGITMSDIRLKPIGSWLSSDTAEIVSDLGQALPHLDKTVYVLGRNNAIRYAVGGSAVLGISNTTDAEPVMAFAPPCLPAELGEGSFCRDYRINYPCYAGSMAHGIASIPLVAAMSEAGMLGFFGSAGLSLDELELTIQRLSERLSDRSFGLNLINSPNDAEWERGAVELFLRYNVNLVEASAYLMPTPALVKYRVKGLRKNGQGKIIALNRIIAKVSRVEVARRFFEPPPPKILEKLTASREITEEEAQWAVNIPLAQDITVEADSGGHTDHRPALTVLSSVMRLAGEIQRQWNYDLTLRVGLAGGIGTPTAAAAAFSMGAAYIVMGSVNQSCTESGASPMVRALLALASQTDVADAPAADMFEMGVTVQVLKKGLRFAERATRLYELYRSYDSIDAIPEDQRRKIEETIFRKSLDEVWKETEFFFEARNPRQLERAAQNPKHKMALIFRWYLGNSVHWASAGIEDRKDDFQIWCGPSMGAFNDWVKGTFLEEVTHRSAPVAALNILHGAAILLRMETLRAQGVPIPFPQEIPCPIKVFPTFMRTRTLEEIS
jgi:trans-AT polyketide synthase, acyltransferase and oxidoreductase domains